MKIIKTVWYWYIVDNSIENNSGSQFKYRNLMYEKTSHIKEEKISYSLNYFRITKETSKKKKIKSIAHILC